MWESSITEYLPSLPYISNNFDIFPYLTSFTIPLSRIQPTAIPPAEE